MLSTLDQIDSRNMRIYCLLAAIICTPRVLTLDFVWKRDVLSVLGESSLGSRLTSVQKFV